jgi:hypothetical protein
MRHVKRVLVVAAIVCFVIIGARANASHPPYLILRQTNGGYAQPTVGHPYAYGWFGVAPRRQTITHTGYYGSHWLWPGQLPQ